MRRSHLICSGIYLMILSGTVSFAYQGTAETSSQTPKPRLLVRKDKPKKKRNKSDNFGPMGMIPISKDEQDIGVGVHRNQEGVDRPYFCEIAGSSEISSYQSNQSASNQKSTQVQSILEYTMIFSRAQVGFNLEYKSLEDKIQANGGDSTNNSASSNQPSVTVTDSDVKLGIGPIIKYNFANIDLSLTVPFIYAGFIYSLEDRRVGSANKVSYDTQAIRIGAGVHMFMASNVSIAPKLEYGQYSSKSSTAPSMTGSGPKFLLQIAVFL